MKDLSGLPPNPTDVLVAFDDYVRARPQFFPKPATPKYFLRFHRAVLLSMGGLVKTASGDLVCPVALDNYILALGRSGLSYRNAPDHVHGAMVVGEGSCDE
jgi:hypothetical protein